MFTLPINANALEMPQMILIVILGGVIGACLGSFAQAAALRLNQGEDVVRKPSRCRQCGQNLKWHDNLPIIGWLMLGGACRNCRTAIPKRYLAIEAIMATISAIIFAFYDPRIAAVMMVAITTMMISGLTDLDEMTLHIPIIMLTGGGGFAVSLLGFGELWPLSPALSLLGMVAAVSLIGGINAAYYLMRGQSGFGSGDYWLMGAAGFWLGPIYAAALFFTASLLGAAAGLIIIAQSKGGPQTAIPFGLFISAAFIFAPIANILAMLIN